jgi:hypothetical protein
MPTITQIPQAADLQQQLDMLIKAIDALGVPGCTVPNMTIMPGAPADPTVPGAYQMAIGLALTPPIDDPDTLAELQTALQAQSETVQQELVDLGYVDDVTKKGE